MTRDPRAEATTAIDKEMSYFPRLWIVLVNDGHYIGLCLSIILSRGLQNV